MSNVRRIGSAAGGALTLDEIRLWPATVSVPRACTVVGISRSHGYELVKTGEFPFRVLRLRGRVAVITSSIIDVLASENEGVA